MIKLIRSIIEETQTYVFFAIIVVFIVRGQIILNAINVEMGFINGQTWQFVKIIVLQVNILPEINRFLLIKHNAPTVILTVWYVNNPVKIAQLVLEQIMPFILTTKVLHFYIILTTHIHNV